MGQVLAGEAGAAGGDAGGEHDLVVGREVFGTGGVVQAEVDAGLGERGLVVVDEADELLLAGDAPGHAELAADLARGLEERDGVAALGGGQRRGEAGGAGAGNGDAPGGGGGGEGDLGLVGGARVDEAGRDLELEGVVEAGLVAGDAGRDQVGAAGAGLFDEGGVGEEGAGHRDEVGVAGGDEALGHLRRVDAVGGDEGDGDLAHQLAGDPGEGGARDRGGDGRHAGLVPADAGGEHVRAGLGHGAGEADALVPGLAAVDEVEERDAVDEERVGADGRAGAADDLEGEAGAVLPGAAPGVGAAVGARGEELVEEVAFAPMISTPS
jgi:hypothetical protein